MSSCIICVIYYPLLSGYLIKDLAVQTSSSKTQTDKSSKNTEKSKIVDTITRIDGVRETLA